MLEALVIVAGVMLCVFSDLGFFDTYAWQYELCVHFRPLYAIFLTLATISCLFWGRRLVAALFFVHALVNAAIVVPYMFFAPDEPDVAGENELRIFSLNVRLRSTAYDAVRDSVLAVDPDVAVFYEVDATWERELQLLQSNYPHRVAEARDDNFGILLLSKLPLLTKEIVHHNQNRRPSIFATVALGKQLLGIVGTHPMPPRVPLLAELRNKQLKELASELAGAEYPMIVVSDLNVTPWSSYFRAFLETADLRDASRGRMIWGTWPTLSYPLAIQIDHLLVSEGVAVPKIYVGDHVGSDHYPLISEVVF